MTRDFETIVSPQLDGARVEQVLRRQLGLSVTRIKRAKFQPDGILLDGQRVFSNAIVRAGQRLTLHLPEQSDSDLEPTPGPVDICYEDEWLLVVNKPAGLVVHPGPGHYADTLGNRLTWLYRQRGEQLVLRSVNRLDKGTSGLLVVAKRAEAHEALQQLLHTQHFCRDYVALTDRCPQPEAGTIDRPIDRVPGALNQYRVSPDGKRAVTAYETLSCRDGMALVGLRLYTGRTHQIRVHMADLGCPLLGDVVYGGPDTFPRPALHSYRLALDHPFTGAHLVWTAPLPEDFRALGWEEPQ